MDRFARRSFGAVAFVLMLLRVVAPELGHQCAMDGPPAPATAAAPHTMADQSHQGHGTANAHSGHGNHLAHGTLAATDGKSAAAAPASHHAPADTENGGCDCADWCCCLPTVADTPRPAVALATITTQQSGVVAISRSETPRAAAARLLPFATAPPSA